MNNLMCPDCDAPMETGFLPEATDVDSTLTYWHRDEPEDATFLGMKVSRNAIKHDKEKMFAITAYRCTDCGLLKLYANPKVS
ncbi:PF20097 family protein [Rhodopirellula bahusiensis]|uniref:PF20097 family protein n=1 Tax=Rhodopirellula bahusiensis TaxID=2014065 RepID=UPI0032656B32